MLKDIYWRLKMINEEQVKHIADLAKLNIKDEEIEKYKK